MVEALFEAGADGAVAFGGGEVRGVFAEDIIGMTVFNIASGIWIVYRGVFLLIAEFMGG